ncbi:MAG TPA: DUF1343 domain-containing protein [Bacteroidales bacterium]|nr:DUF1343 domain-containing protein [Bacteroidales bacterium]
MKRFILYLLLLIGVSFVLTAPVPDSLKLKNPIPGAYNIKSIRRYLEGKSVAIVANQTSMIEKTHIVDSLLSLDIDLKVIFAPEHGFRNLADAGESISDGKDTLTDLPIISLYGKHVKPTAEDLSGIDVVVFDIQDVGARFYTYISTLHYLLEACAENNVSCIVLDRPNPNGYYVDGNVLDTVYKSFVGLDPIPVVHGMTVGEYALMLNGEGWLKNGVKCDLEVVKCRNYLHSSYYNLPVKPSPNLPNQTSVYLYPSLCFFEGTNISVGRGTSFPFQVFGSPRLPDRGFSFVPESTDGAKNPPFLGERCFGTDLRNALSDEIVLSPGINLEWVINAYNDYPDKQNFFTSYFDVLAGGPEMREQIIKGLNEEQIRQSWQDELDAFKKIRSKYLLYK